MKNNFKFLIVLTILLAGCICIGSTFAADSDIAVTDVNIDNTQQNIEIAHDDSSTKNNEIPNLQAGEGNFTELQNIIYDKTSYTLTNNYKYSSGDDENCIAIYKDNFVLDGDGFTIDGSGLARAFIITGKNVTIKNIKFVNTKSTDYYSGSAILGLNGVKMSNCLLDDCKCTVSNCSFVNCSATGFGGAICFNDGSKNVAISGCSFVNCSTNSSGGAIFCLCDNGSVSDCNFTNTIASGKGNAIYIYSGASLSITDCSCNSMDSKAPIYNEGTILSDVVITTIDGKTKQVNNGEKVNLTGIVTASGMRVAGGVLTLTINGTELNATSDETGLYSTIDEYTVDFNGTKPVTATYNNSTGYQSVIPGELSTEKLDVSVSVDDVTGVVGDDKTVTVTVLDVNGDLVTDGVVSILWNGENQTKKVSNGTATFNLALANAGEYLVTAYYDGSATTDYQDGEGNFTVTVNKIPVTITIDPVKGKVGEKVKVTATVTDENGNLVPDGEVTFELNGEKYIASIKDGIATTYVILPDNPGNYTLTAYYAGNGVYQDAYDVFIVELTAKDIPSPNPNNNNPIGNMENTGNPLLVLLIALGAVGLESFRRKF